MSNQGTGRHAASFRDPKGFVFSRDGIVYRQINHAAQNDYDALMGSGLYQELVKASLLISHEEIDEKPAEPETAYKIIRPQQLPIISYPYEWSFSQLKDAALVTLAIQRRALAKSLSLKDASAYNIQFVGAQAVLIDTLSFEKYEAGSPWVAYRQFCQHFLAPLALMSHVDLRLGLLLRDFIDGIPLDLARKLLPGSSRFNLGLLSHIHLHAASQNRLADKQLAPTRYHITHEALLGTLDNLEATIKGLKFPEQTTEWGEYPDNTNYSHVAHDAKAQLIADWLETIKPTRVVDVGANAGEFSRIGVRAGAFTIASDIDPVAVERNYRKASADHETNLLPLVIDITNPSPALGWASAERTGFLERAQADVVFCLALVHHLAISNNLPFSHIADLFADMGTYLIIEFVPKDDSNAQKLLASRKDIFPNYTEAGLEAGFSERFEIIEKERIADSKRTLYLLKRKA